MVVIGEFVIINMNFVNRIVIDNKCKLADQIHVTIYRALISIEIVNHIN